MALLPIPEIKIDKRKLPKSKEIIMKMLETRKRNKLEKERLEQAISSNVIGNEASNKQ